jgi:hypothetical protein
LAAAANLVGHPSRARVYPAALLTKREPAGRERASENRTTWNAKKVTMTKMINNLFDTV